MTNPPQADAVPAGLKTLLIGLLVLAILVTGVWLGRPACRAFQEKSALKMAAKCIAASDYAGASICARRALSANGTSLEGSKIMAELAQRSGSPLLLHWRQRVAELEPTFANKLLLARVALKEQKPPFPVAAEVLTRLADEGKNSTEYQSLAGQLALLQNRTSEAERFFLAAARLEPRNEGHTLNLAVLRLKSTNAPTRAEARATLEGLANATNLAAVAMRWLVSDAISARDFVLAESYSGRMITNTDGVTLEDRLRHGEIILQTHPSDFPSFVGDIKELCHTNASQIQIVSAWMASRGMARETFEWLIELPTEVRTQQPVPMAIAACCAMNGDWQKLEEYLRGQDWRETEFLRLGFLGKAATERGRVRDASLLWNMAAQKAGDDLGPLLLLANMASQFQVSQPREDLLWKIVQRHPHQKWASKELESVYTGRGSTEKLRSLYGIMANYEPGNYQARNNFAATSLLLRKDLIIAHESARELYIAHPGDAVIASTYAFSLHLQGRSKEGISVLEQMKKETLETGKVSFYYGILMAANGRTEMAKKLLINNENRALLPEESALRREAIGK